MVDRTHDETKLWESFIKGETAAFEEVYRRYYSLLYSYGIRMVGDRELGCRYHTESVRQVDFKL